MTDTERLALALAAIEAAKGIVSQVLYDHDEPGDLWCECCGCVVSPSREWGHATNCATRDFLELVTKLEAAK